MNKEDYVKVINEKLDGNSKKIVLNQINNYYDAESYELGKSKYAVGDDVYLKKGTLLHGTSKNLEGLKSIVKTGLIASWFVGERDIEGNSGYIGKYPSSVGVWNLQENYFLRDYIDFYSGGSAFYYNLNDDKQEREIVPFSKMNNFINNFIGKDFAAWRVEQTKEARFLPNLVQTKVQVGIIFNGDNQYIKQLLNCDILDQNNINDSDVKDFVNPNYYEKFIVDRKNKDIFFTNRESAVLFGIPSNFIEGILVGRDYEKDKKILTEIKMLLPNCYICNLDGKVIVE